MEDMYLRTFRMPSIDEIEAMVNDLIDAITNTVARAATLISVDGSVDGMEVYFMTSDECNRVTCHRDNKAYVVLHYGLSDAFVGDVSYDESPASRFIDAAFDAVKDKLEDRGINVTY